MIVNRQIFKYEDITLVEKMKVSTPLKYEAIFQNRGCFIYYKNGGAKLLSPEQNVQIHGKEAVLLKCGSHFLDILKNANGEEIEAIVIHLDPQLLKRIYIKELPTLLGNRGDSKQSLKIASSNIISKFIESLDFYFENPELVNNDLLELKIKELVLLLIQTKNIDSIQELITDLYTTKTVQLKDVVELHTFSNLTIEELAKLCNMSVSSFKRTFKTVFDDTPNNYINAKKIKKAKELLHITNMGISDVAYEVGFNDPQYFARLFKKKVGISPTAHRSQNKS